MLWCMQFNQFPLNYDLAFAQLHSFLLESSRDMVWARKLIALHINLNQSTKIYVACVLSQSVAALIGHIIHPFEVTCRDHLLQQFVRH